MEHLLPTEKTSSWRDWGYKSVKRSLRAVVVQKSFLVVGLRVHEGSLSPGFPEPPSVQVLGELRVALVLAVLWDSSF